MYLAYALFCEGSSDYSYFEVLLPRVIESTVLRGGRVTVDVPERPAVRLGRRGRTVGEVAAEACDRRGAFHVVFVHADTGGRGQLARVGHRSSAYCRWRQKDDVVQAARRASPPAPPSERVNQGRAASQQLDPVFRTAKGDLILALREAVDPVPMHAPAVDRDGREINRDIVGDETPRQVGARLKLGGNLAGSGRPALEFQRGHPRGCVAPVVEVQVVAAHLVRRPGCLGVVHVEKAVAARQSRESEPAAFLPAGRGAAPAVHLRIDTFQQGPQWSAASCARFEIRAQSL